MTLNTNGSFTYQFTGADGVSDGATVYDTFTYTARDYHGQEGEASVTFETLLDSDLLYQQDLVTNADLIDII